MGEDYNNKTNDGQRFVKDDHDNSTVYVYERNKF
jgi:hypothetical protein